MFHLGVITILQLQLWNVYWDCYSCFFVYSSKFFEAKIVFVYRNVQNGYFRISLGTILSEELLFNTRFSLTWKFVVLICGCIVIYFTTNRFLWESQLNLFDPRLLQNTWIRRNAGPKVFFFTFHYHKKRYEGLMQVIKTFDTAQKRNFSMKCFFSKRDQIRNFLPMWLF